MFKPFLDWLRGKEEEPMSVTEQIIAQGNAKEPMSKGEPVDFSWKEPKITTEGMKDFVHAIESTIITASNDIRNKEFLYYRGIRLDKTTFVCTGTWQGTKGVHLHIARKVGYLVYADDIKEIDIDKALDFVGLFEPGLYLALRDKCAR